MPNVFLENRNLVTSAADTHLLLPLMITDRTCRIKSVQTWSTEISVRRITRRQVSPADFYSVGRIKGKGRGQRFNIRRRWRRSCKGQAKSRDPWLVWCGTRALTLPSLFAKRCRSTMEGNYLWPRVYRLGLSEKTQLTTCHSICVNCRRLSF